MAGDEPEGTEKLSEDIIKHISGEIIAEMAYLASIRTRVGFTVLTGPFIVVGSVLVAFKGPVDFKDWHNPILWWSLGGAFVSYMIASLYFAMIDHHTTRQCNQWRDTIVDLLQGKKLKERMLKAGLFRKERTVSSLHFEHYAQFAYPLGFLIICLAFISVTSIIMQLRPVPSAQDSDTTKVHIECCQNSATTLLPWIRSHRSAVGQS
jgi:hypothetical protein